MAVYPFVISLRNLRLARGAKVLIEGATLQIHPGWKVGLTGANGSGKSSLFALLRDQLHPDQGDLDMPPGWVIAHVAQETPGLAQPAIDYVLDGDAELRRIEAELAAAEAAHDGDGPISVSSMPACTRSAATRRVRARQRCSTAWASCRPTSSARWRTSPAAGACA